MTEKRNRTPQTTSLEERVAKFTDGLRQKAEQLPEGTDEALELKRRIKSGEAALRLNAALGPHSGNNPEK